MTPLEEALKRCDHKRVEDVRNGNGVVIGRQCSTCCIVLSGVGMCAGCGQTRRDLRVRVADRLYCDTECRAEGDKRVRREAQSKRQGAPGAQQVEMPWAREDRHR